jgi:hypothetical protein
MRGGDARVERGVGQRFELRGGVGGAGREQRVAVDVVVAALRGRARQVDEPRCVRFKERRVTIALAGERGRGLGGQRDQLGVMARRTTG